MAKCQHCGCVCQDDFQCCPECFSVLPGETPKSVLNLWNCRIISPMKSISLIWDNREEELCKIAIGLDITTKRGSIAYGIGERIHIMRCQLPWKYWKMDTVEDLFQFEGCISGLKTYLKNKRIGVLETIILTVPYSFSYLQRRAIHSIAQSMEIDIREMDSVGHFSSLCRYKDQLSENVCGIYCNLQDNYFEVTAVEHGNRFCKSLGTTGLAFKEGWQSISENDFYARVFSESKQFLRDIGYLDEMSHPVDHDKRIIVHMIGQRNHILEYAMSDLIGKYIEEDYPMDSSVGCLLQTEIPEENFVITQDKKIWIGLGINGEHQTCIERYTHLPASGSVRLQLSTETDLNIYEGNIENPDYDRLIITHSLKGFTVEEGKEIECRIDIDRKKQMTLMVINHKGKKIINSYRL